MDDDHDPSFQASQRNQPRFLVIETVIHEGYAGSGEHIFRIFKAQTVFFAVPFALFLVPFVPGGTLLCNYNCKYISWQKSRKALYGFRTVLECAGKAARPNWTSAMEDTSSVRREPGRRLPLVPRRRRFPLTARPWFGTG